MGVTRQVVHQLKIRKLKNLRELEINFKDIGLTAVLGTNGSGKSTLLHALACCYSNMENSKSRNFSNYFRNTTNINWNESEFEMKHSYYQIEKNRMFEKQNTKYRKSVKKWSPEHARRVPRAVFYLGIETCVPVIESDKKINKVNFKSQIGNSTYEKVLRSAAQVMQKQYADYSEIVSDRKIKLIEISSGGLKYSSHSMGAGEQRIFKILETVLFAKNYSLILIDEIDLLLHINAFKKLINELIKIAEEKKLQIIFTTHEQKIEEFKDKIEIRHIWQTQDKTLCLDGINLSEIYNLTGVQEKYFKVFVEDLLSKAVIEKIFCNKKLQKYLSVDIFGAAINAFTIAAGLVLNKSDLKNTIIILDGDVYSLTEEKEQQIKKIITGHGEVVGRNRDKSLELITQYTMPRGKNPEKYIFELIKNSENEKIKNSEIYEIAKEISVVNDNHECLNIIIERLGQEKYYGYQKIIDLFAMTEEWKNFIEPIEKWIEAKLKFLNL